MGCKRARYVYNGVDASAARATIILRRRDLVEARGAERCHAVRGRYCRRIEGDANVDGCLWFVLGFRLVSEG